MTSAHDYDDPGKPRIAWNDKQARDTLVDALVRDALAVLAALPAQPPGPAADAVGLLALIAGQDVELVDPDGPDGPDGPDDEGGPPRWRIAQQVAADRVISVVDPDARHAHKTVHRRQDGFKAHVAVEPDTGLVTACQLTKAAGAAAHDAVVGVDLLTGETAPVQVLGDSAYATGEALAAFDETDHERWSSPGRSSRPCPAGSPSTTSRSTPPPAPSPARLATPSRSARPAPHGSVPVAPPVRWRSDAHGRTRPGRSPE